MVTYVLYLDFNVEIKSKKGCKKNQCSKIFKLSLLQLQEEENGRQSVFLQKR